jgi:hypothetical protein
VTFRRIASKMERAEELQPETDAFDAEDSEMAAMAALLLPVKLTYTNGVGWRLQIPANSYLASASAEGGFYAIFSQGYLEFWKQESLEKALQKARSDLTAQ